MKFVFIPGVKINFDNKLDTNRYYSYVFFKVGCVDCLVKFSSGSQQKNRLLGIRKHFTK
jgi:hypothetical protein